jgi:hypothetical protein
MGPTLIEFGPQHYQTLCEEETIWLGAILALLDPELMPKLARALLSERCEAFRN